MARRRGQFRVRALLLVWSGSVITGAVAALPATGESLPHPRVELQKTPAGVTKVFVRATLPDGTDTRALVRETAAPVAVTAAGRDPGQAAAFVTWREGGSAEPWFAISRDAGRTWAAASSRPTELRLRDGATRPGAALPVPQRGLRLPPRGRIFLVQFKTVGLPEWRAALTAAGAEVLNYFPHNAHLVRIDPSRVQHLAALEFVERVEPFHPWYRLDAQVRAWLDTPGTHDESRRVNVLAFEWGGAPKRRIAQAAAGLGARVANLFETGQILEIDVTRAQLEALVAHDDVQWVDFWSAPEQDMDLLRQDAGADWLETNHGYCGTGVRGEVLDAGVQQDHPDFDGIILHGPANTDNHGTSTYGIIFGNGSRDGDGDARARGTTPCAQGIFADYDAMGDRFAHTQELKGAPYHASFQSNSWGSERTRAYTSRSFQLDDIVWRLDIAILQSQSNAGTQDSRPEAWAKNVISVGAVTHNDTPAEADDCWCGTASIGPAEDGRIKPDLSYWGDAIYTTTTGSGYTAGFAGTSAATPATAGLTGLLIEMWADGVWGTDPRGSTVFEKQPHAATIKALAINNATQYGFTGTDSDLTRVHQGWGRVDVQRAKERAQRSLVIDESVALTLDELAAYDVTVDPGEQELKVTLVYQDPPGTTAATLHRINDIDLKVTAPDGTVYRGNNGLTAGNYSTPGGSRNTADTVENVFVLHPEAGVWQVEISVAELNQDQHRATLEPDAVFALVVTGGSRQTCAAPVADYTISPNPARVGQQVLFDSAVSGGAGGPYFHEWFLDGDGVADAKTAAATYVYARPFAGSTTLRVIDNAGCATSSVRDIEVTGPDLRAAGYVEDVEVEGNGNGAIDPGEVWDVRLQLRNEGTETAVAVAAGLAAATDNPGPLSVLVPGPVPFGSIPPGATVAAAQAVRFHVGSNFPCGNDARFSVVGITSADPANRYPDEVGLVHALVGGAGPARLFYADGLESDLGWTLGAAGEWQVDSPRGLGAGGGVPGQPPPQPDPTAAYQGARVLGTDLTGLGVVPGRYETNVSSYAISPAIDCSGAHGVTLRFQRWLNVAPNDTATVEVSADGSTWSTLASLTAVADGAWAGQEFDLATIADGSPSVRIRFGIESDGVVTLSGWNIDAIELWGVVEDSCEPFARGAPGAASGLRVERAGSDLALGWTGDCGAGTTYAIYRGDLDAGYASLAAEAGRCAVTGTATTVPRGAGRADFFLIVPNAGGFEGSYGSTSAGSPRVPPAGACWPHDAVDSCAR